MIGDADRIQQVLQNLLSNARKFVPRKHGLITLKTGTFTKNETLFLQISVRDNGCGISKEDVKKLFKPFSKLADSQHVNPEGNGLGLNICKSICVSLGGDIKVESLQGAWTEFTFWVPVKEQLNLADLD